MASRQTEDITSQEACQILGVTPTTLATWARTGVIPARKIEGRNKPYIYRRVDVVRHAATRAAATRENAS